MSSRIQYFLIHFILSVCLVGGLLLTMLWIWYPTPLANTTGILSIMLMLVSIDVIIGPILSLLVYKQGKKTLKFDLSCIIVLQVLALSYGVYSIAQARPAWIVFTLDRFELIRNNDVVLEDIIKVKEQYKTTPWFGPKVVAAVRTGNRVHAQHEEFASGISLSQNPEKYHQLSVEQQKIKEKAHALSELYLFNSKKDVDNQLNQNSDLNAWLPLQGPANDKVVLLDTDNLSNLKIVDLRPWN